ncbi:MAG: hypothetical protein RR316_04900 [Clostridia bacterium]
MQRKIKVIIQILLELIHNYYAVVDKVVIMVEMYVDKRRFNVHNYVDKCITMSVIDCVKQFNSEI